jgi:predicted RNA-binding protein with PIN domain
MEQFYVSVSRGKQAVSIYTDDKESLKQAVSLSSERKSATELLSKNERVKSAVNEQNRLSVLKKMREKTVETYDNLKSKIRKNELQRTVRTSQGKAR